MYSLFTGHKMLRSRQLVRGCCRCKLMIGHKNKEGSLLLKKYIHGTNIIFRRSQFIPLNNYNTTSAYQTSFPGCYESSLSRKNDHIVYLQHSRGFKIASCIQAESKKPSSKVEETTEAIKEKTKEISEKKPDLLEPIVASHKAVVVKKTLWQKVKDEIHHYYHGFKLLFIDIRVSSSLVGKVLKGGSLTRREYNLLIRTVGDMFRLVPFSIFIIVPFMELLLPVFIKLFPGMLPSTFQTAKDKDDKMKQSLKVKLEMAKFLQQTLDEMSVTGKGHSSQAAKDFIEFFHKVRTEGGGLASNEEILKFSKLFADELTLDSLTRSQLMALCRVLELQPFGTTPLLLFQLRLKLRSLAADDRRIEKEGIASLTQTELQQACRLRGMRALGMSEERLRMQLTQWLDLSLNEKVPPSLLLLSRALMLPDSITTTEKLVATISALPDTAATKAKAVIGEREGKVDNKTKIELIKDDLAKIQEEKKEIEEEALHKVTEKLEEEIVDKAQILIDKAKTLVDKPKEEKDLSAQDIGETLEDVLDAVGRDKKKMIIEKEELDDLKEEMKDYHKDVQDLKDELAKAPDKELDVKESKAAKRLSRTVNKMISKMDRALSELEKKEVAIKETLQKDESQTSSDELLKVDELIEAIKQLQTVPDASRFETIKEVLGKIDIDKDGVVKVDDLLKVLEVIGRENIKLTQKQIDEVIELLKKEDEVLEDVGTDEKIGSSKGLNSTAVGLNVNKAIDDSKVSKLQEVEDLSSKQNPVQSTSESTVEQKDENGGTAGTSKK